MSVLFTRRGKPPLGLPPIGTALNDCTWDEISKISNRGLGADYFSVGDRKAVTLNSTVGSLSLSGTYYAYIIGIDHNSSVEGNGITFQFGFNTLSDGANIAFVDGNYGTKKTTGSLFNMNNSESNSGGWESSLMRTTICPAFKDCLPSELQAVLKKVTKYTDNTGNGTLTASCVTATEDDIFLLSEFEVRGSRNYANTTEQNYQKQYTWYSAGNSKVMYKHDATTTAGYWWLRSVANNSGIFCCVTNTGGASNATANYSYGFSPAFVI